MPKHFQSDPAHTRRLSAERRFRWYGKAALSVALMILALLLGTLFVQGYQGVRQTYLRLDVAFDPAQLELLPGEAMKDASPSALQKLATEALRSQFPQVADRHELRKLKDLVSTYAGRAIKDEAVQHPEWEGGTQTLWLLASSNADLYAKGLISRATPEADRSLSDAQLGWLDELQQQGRLQVRFNAGFFLEGDSRAPEQAGFLGAILGSLLTMLVCLSIVFPIGVMTAVYLEEFASKSRFVDWVEININNLAAVPSIVFGLLGLAVYINVLALPRSAPLVGGLTLAMMVLPVVIISTRVSIAAIPSGIRDAARGLGASPVQVVWHHVLPLAMPGIMTGTILGMARAIGETAPLIMIGMVAFVADLPAGIYDSATVMPVQVYLWASSPEAGFAQKTAAGILLLLVILLALNMLAILLRKRFEIRW